MFKINVTTNFKVFKTKEFWFNTLKEMYIFVYASLFILVGNIVARHFGIDTSFKTWMYYYVYMFLLILVPLRFGPTFIDWLERKMLNSDKAS